MRYKLVNRLNLHKFRSLSLQLFNLWYFRSNCGYTLFILSLSMYTLCLSACPFVSNNMWDLAHDPREGLWIIEFSKICLHQNYIFDFFKSKKFVIKSANLFVCFCLTMWCLFVSNKSQNGWTDRSKFWVHIIWPQVRFMDERIFEIRDFFMKRRVT